MTLAFLVTSLVIVATPGTGAIYLLYLAWQTWRDKSSLQSDSTVAPPSTAQVIRQAVLINILNPKLTIFFFVFLPQFVQPNDPGGAVRQMLLLSGVFMVLTLVVFAGYGVFAAGMRSKVLDRPRVVTWLRRIFAGSYVALAGRLALPER